MAVSLNTKITQADMDALAALANANLLPLVNADIAAHRMAWGYWTFDAGKLVSASGSIRNLYAIPDLADPSNAPSYLIKNPQPAYAFDPDTRNWMSELNRIRGDLYALMNNAVTGAEAIFQSLTTLVSGPYVVGVNDLDTLTDGVYLGVGDGVYDAGGKCVVTIPMFRVNPLQHARWIKWIPNNSTSITIGQTTYGPEYAYKVLPLDGAESVTLTGPPSGSLGPFSDAGLYLITNIGVLLGSEAASNYPTDFPAFTIFKEVSFYTTDASAIIYSAAGDGSMIRLNPDVSHVGNNYTVKITLDTDTAGTVKSEMRFRVTLTGTAPAITAIAATLGEVSMQLVSAGIYDVRLVVDSPLAAASSTWLQIDFTVTAGAAVAVSAADLTPAFIYATHDFLKMANVADPGGIGYRIDCGAEVTPVFTVSNATQTFYLTGCWWLNNAAIKGIWTAKTLPVPGRNVYLDQDLPPFVGQLLDRTGDIPTNSGAHPHELFAVSPTLPDSADYGSFIMASSMRQKGSVLGPREDLPPAVAALFPWVPISKFGIVQSSLAARPAPWPVLRDTDFAPYDLGFEQNILTYWNTDLTAAPDALVHFFKAVPASAKSVLVRCVAANTGRRGWKGGNLVWGDPLAAPFTIYVKKAAAPSTVDYDFKVTANELTIDPDGGGNYLATVLGTGFYYAIENTGGAPVGFDVCEEVWLVDSPLRQFLPDARECFSISLTGEPALWKHAYSVGGYYNQYSRRRVPRSGYCIFKVRATRLPVTNPEGVSVIPDTGDRLTITFGQNRLNADGTITFQPFETANGGIGAGNAGTGAGATGTGAGGIMGAQFSVVIPANSGTSGDVAVFIPVLGGNEVVYRCDVPVVFEVWADWQPMFFNAFYGIGNPYPYAADFAPNRPTSFQYALAFINHVDVSISGYDKGAVGAWNVPLVQFPMSIEIYNDLETIINLL